jgi:hypothetical protein
MPKRVLDFDAMWASDKLGSCAAWAQAEYAWLYGLADASGSFEITNLRVIWGRVAAIRNNLTIERLEQVFDEFIARGLLFTWEENGKRYGHWTGSDVPGRLPPLKQELEATQAQGLDLGLDTNKERDVKPASAPVAAAVSAQAAPEKYGQTQFSFPVEKTAEQPRSSFPPTLVQTNYGRDERAMSVAREIHVGAGPVLGPHSAARVKPAALERARRLAAAGRGTPGGTSG